MFFYTHLFSGKVTLQKHRIIKAIQLNRLVLDENEKQKIIKCFTNKISHKNFCMLFTLSKTFYFSIKGASIYMDSWFLNISETKNFLQLAVILLEKIISRSSLLVTTEIEVHQVVLNGSTITLKKESNLQKGCYTKYVFHCYQRKP